MISGPVFALILSNSSELEKTDSNMEKTRAAIWFGVWIRRNEARKRRSEIGAI